MDICSACSREGPCSRVLSGDTLWMRWGCSSRCVGYLRRIVRWAGRGHLGVVWVTYIRRALCALSSQAHSALHSAGQARPPCPMLQQRATRGYWILRRGRGEAAATEVFVTCSA